MRSTVRPIRSVRKAVSTSAEKFPRVVRGQQRPDLKEFRVPARANRYHPRHIAIVKWCYHPGSDRKVKRQPQAHGFPTYGRESRRLIFLTKASAAIRASSNNAR